MLLGHDLEPADVILALGSNDVRVGEHAARLFLRGLAPLLVCSGHVGRLTAGRFEKSEAETFADAAVRLGVPRSAILLEDDPPIPARTSTCRARCWRRAA